MASKAKKSTQRKLTAILSADVVGYSRLMGADEEATVATLGAYRKVLVSEIEKHHGRVVDAKGDALLAEFASVVDAVNSAVEIQRELAERNAELPDDRRMDFRIGVNLGDVIVKDDVIYGDGVNIAARVESLAEAGGVCISGSAYAQVRNKLKLEYEFLGKKEVKNIEEPVPAYKVRLEPAAKVPTTETSSAPHSVATATSLVAQQSQPSIAVLPFKNMSGDPEQDYFADGISEDLITDLSKISRLSVISQNTAFTYKGRAVNLKQVGKELGVQYVLEGSVRKADSRVRITAQLINTVTDHHLWSERYDRELADIFEVQDEITQNIVTALDVLLLDGEQASVWRKATLNSQAYDMYLRGRSCWHSTFSRQGCDQASRFYDQAIALDENFSVAYVALADLQLQAGRLGWGQPLQQRLAKAYELANKAISLDHTLADAYAVLGRCHFLKKQHDLALAETEKAIRLNPNSADVLSHLARIQVYAGKPDLAVENIRKAKGIAPFYPAWYQRILGHAYFTMGRYDDALTALNESLQAAPDAIITHVFLAATYAALDQNDDAKVEAKEILRIDPDFTLEQWVHRALPYKNPERLEQMMFLLRKAGLTE